MDSKARGKNSDRPQRHRAGEAISTEPVDMSGSNDTSFSVIEPTPKDSENEASRAPRPGFVRFVPLAQTPALREGSTGSSALRVEVPFLLAGFGRVLQIFKSCLERALVDFRFF